MKRLLRVLVVIAGVFLLLGTRKPGIAQLGPQPPVSCCDAGSATTDWAYPCDACKGPQGNFEIPGGCSNTIGGVETAGPCEGGTGLYNVFTRGGGDCQQTGDNGCLTGDSCPSSYTVNYWAYDPMDCTPTPGCFSQGMSCSSTSDCCSNLQCLGTVGSLTCQPCAVAYACTPAGASRACGETSCDGSCSAECSYDSNCWQNGQEGTCNHGCCEYGSSGCASNLNDSCGSCGTIQCDGSCNDPCNTCAWNSGYNCGSCGTVQCDGSCDDSCSGGGGGGGAAVATRVEAALMVRSASRCTTSRCICTYPSARRWIP
jgi:hypothetical protein